VGKVKRVDVYLEVRKRRGHTFFEGNKCLCFCRFVVLSMAFGPKLVGLQSSVGTIKLLFIIPTVNRNVLT
jgi:hypothetical protein